MRFLLFAQSAQDQRSDMGNDLRRQSFLDPERFGHLLANLWSQGGHEFIDKTSHYQPLDLTCSPSLL
jgi:hypothetical protein